MVGTAEELACVTSDGAVAEEGHGDILRILVHDSEVSYPREEAGWKCWRLTADSVYRTTASKS